VYICGEVNISWWTKHAILSVEFDICFDYLLTVFNYFLSVEKLQWSVIEASVPSIVGQEPV